MRSFFVIICILISFDGFSQRKYSPVEIRSDIDTLFSKLDYIHPNLYAYTSKDSIFEQLRGVESNLKDSLSILDFWFLIAPIVNGLNQGHTEVTPNREDVIAYENRFKENGDKILPIDVIIRDTLIIVKKVLNDNKISPGSIIKSINNISSKEILAKMLINVSGERKEYRLTKVEPFFASQFSFYYPSKYFNLKLVDHKDKQFEVVLNGISHSAIDSFYLKKYFSRPDFNFRTINGNIGFLEINNFYENDKFKSFIDSVFENLTNTKSQNLIIDIRNNGGGDTRVCDEIITYLTDRPYKEYKIISVKLTKDIRSNFEYFSSFHKDTSIIMDAYNNNASNKKYRFKGNVFVLTGSSTFSSATYFAMIIKDYNLGTLVGEETGGLPTGYGDIFRFQLPITKINCAVSYKSFVRPSGLVNNRGVIPDYIIKPSIDDLIKGSDKVMGFVLKKIEEK